MAAVGVTLFIGGARSGKSRHAQRAAEALPGRLVFVATGEALDDEMAERIARHRDERGGRWQTIECPLRLAATIEAESEAGTVILIDCLTLWLSNLLCHEEVVDAAARSLEAALARTQARVFLVSNEVGAGIVPDNALARRFRDEAGWLNQRVAACADEVFLITAGLGLRLK